MSGTFRVGLIQNCAGPETAENLDRAEERIREAAGEGADLILTPEFFSCLHVDDEAIHTDPNPEESHTALKRMRGLARDLGRWIVVGSIAVPGPDGRAYNRCYVIDAEAPGDLGSALPTS